MTIIIKSRTYHNGPSIGETAVGAKGEIPLTTKIPLLSMLQKKVQKRRTHVICNSVG